MRTPFLKPGFEFIFSLSLLAILGLPPMLMAQNQKDVEIKIVNGDTTVNGKNIKELSAEDRKSALKDINHLSSGLAASGDDGKKHVFMFKRRDTLGGGRMKRRQFTESIVINTDTMSNVTEMRPGNAGQMKKRMSFQIRPDGGMPDRGRVRGRINEGPYGGLQGRFERRNSQNFSYVNTDNEGISTRVTFHVSEVSNDDLQRMPHIEGGKLELTDLNIVPEFSTGKTLLMFNLPAKTAGTVSLLDSEGKALWTEKFVGASFSKSFVLGLNGIYYLQVKQGNSIGVKRIMKEE